MPYGPGYVDNFESGTLRFRVKLALATFGSEQTASATVANAKTT
jgi:hypothetical protein